MNLVRQEYVILDEKMTEYNGRRIDRREPFLKLTELEARFGITNGSLRPRGPQDDDKVRPAAKKRSQEEMSRSAAKRVSARREAAGDGK